MRVKDFELNEYYQVVNTEIFKSQFPTMSNLKFILGKCIEKHSNYIIVSYINTPPFIYAPFIYAHNMDSFKILKFVKVNYNIIKLLYE